MKSTAGTVSAADTAAAPVLRDARTPSAAVLPARTPLRGGACLVERTATERRSYAEASQVDRAFDPSVDAAELEGLKADAVIECSGSEPGMRGAQAAARPEGTIVVVVGGRTGLDPLTILVKELRVQGCFTYVDEFAEMISLTDRWRAPSHRSDFRDRRHRRRPRRFRATPDASTMKIFSVPNGS